MARKRKSGFRGRKPHVGKVVGPPPDDFRMLSVCPTPADILSADQPYLRPNVTRGPYAGVDHYLDVQFRLMREDFLRPLREGIAGCRNGREASADKSTLREANADSTTLRLCTNVTFNNVTFSRDALCVHITLDPKQDNFGNNDKAFMFGSLVLFSRDGFDTMIRATVMDSQSSEAKKRTNLQVKLINDEDLFAIDFHECYTMAESVAFFEPYFRVMTALQTMTLEAYPMCRYITGEANTTQPPSYTTGTADGNARDWPSADHLGLNPAQYDAYKGALIREFAIVQGPPGTGKTYLGSKVAQALVDDAANTAGKPTPLLVVCATNHALDQFLDNILSFTQDLVRVGNQSKSDKLKAYLLSAQRKNYR